MMPEKSFKPRKVVIIGAGAVGSTFAYSLALSGLADEIVLLDANQNLATGQALDLVHGQPFFPSVQIREGVTADYADADLIVMTAGVKQQPDESRLDLLLRNAGIVRGVVDEIVAQNSSAVLLMVSNPVDILTHVARERSGWPRGRVIGSGTVLDSARFRNLLSKHCGLDVHNVHAYILGEHGDSEFAAWSISHMAGIPFREYCARCGKCGPQDNMSAAQNAIEREVRESAYHIIGYKGATWFAVGLALTRIAGAVLRNEHSVLTVSAALEGEYGQTGVTLGVPCVIGREGVERVLEPNLPPDERDALVRSASILKKAMADMGIAG